MNDAQRAQLDVLLTDLHRALNSIDNEIEIINAQILTQLGTSVQHYNWVVDRAVNYCNANGINENMILTWLLPIEPLQRMDPVRESLQKLQELVGD